MSSWEIYPGRKKSIKLRYPMYGPEAYLWTWNRRWLKDFLKHGLITNLEYLEGIEMLKEVKSK
jgi:hypothetical protein